MSLGEREIKTWYRVRGSNPPTQVESLLTSPKVERDVKLGTVDGNRTRRSLIDSEISTPVELYGKIVWWTVRDSNSYSRRAKPM